MAKTPKNGADNRGSLPGEAAMLQAHGGAIGQRPYVATDEDRAFVVENACLKGRPWTCRQIGISMSTLYKHYKAEIEESKANACAQIGPSLFQKALAGDGASQRFFLITQGNGEWSPKLTHEHSGPKGGPIQRVDLTPLFEGKTDDELRNIIAALELISTGVGVDIAGDGSDLASTG